MSAPSPAAPAYYGATVAAFLLLAWIALMPALAAEPAHFVGTQACAGCHAAATEAWRQSHHAQAMQRATAGTVLGNFAGATFRQADVTTTFFRDRDRFMARTDGSDGALHDYPIAYTFGVYPLQQYLIGFPGGRYQAFAIAWDSRPADQGGKRWYSLYPDQNPRGGNPLHWTGRDQTWNYQCAACHSTNLRKQFDLAANSYATTFTDVNVGCEACHGLGSAHLEWTRTRALDPRKGLVIPLTGSNRGTWKMDLRTGIARRQDAGSDTEMNACGGCHARRSVIAEGSTGATPFLDSYLPALLEPGLYHADGQIDGEVFEYGSFVQSRMYQSGVTGANCHEPHAGTLRATGNNLCAQCHAPRKFDTAGHHHHPAGSAGAQCVNCHMPAKTYMGVDQRRDHSFRVPRPDLTEQIGVPDTCTACHADKPAAWAATATAAWFPNGRQRTLHYGVALHAARAGAADAEVRLDALIGDATAPSIARATALQSLTPYATSRSEPGVLHAAGDPDPLVRLAASAALAGVPSPAVIAAISGLLTDPIRAVRIQAARALASLDPARMPQDRRAALEAASRELTDAEMVNADRPEAHMNLGTVAARGRRLDDAEAHHKAALSLDPGFVPSLVNLADIQRMRGQDQEGAALLRKAISLEPRNADVHFALGLLLVRQRDPAAMSELQRAHEFAPDNTRYAYVYAVALAGAGKSADAMDLLERTHRQHPADRDVLAALVSYALRKGDRASALRHARALADLDPDNADIARLLRQQGPR